MPAVDNVYNVCQTTDKDKRVLLGPFCGEVGTVFGGWRRTAGRACGRKRGPEDRLCCGRVTPAVFRQCAPVRWSQVQWKWECTHILVLLLRAHLSPLCCVSPPQLFDLAHPEHGSASMKHQVPYNLQFSTDSHVQQSLASHGPAIHNKKTARCVAVSVLLCALLSVFVWAFRNDAMHVWICHAHFCFFPFSAGDTDFSRGFHSPVFNLAARRDFCCTVLGRKVREVVCSHFGLPLRMEQELAWMPGSNYHAAANPVSAANLPGNSSVWNSLLFSHMLLVLFQCMTLRNIYESVCTGIEVHINDTYAHFPWILYSSLALSLFPSLCLATSYYLYHTTTCRCLRGVAVRRPDATCICKIVTIYVHIFPEYYIYLFLFLSFLRFVSPTHIYCTT